MPHSVCGQDRTPSVTKRERTLCSPATRSQAWDRNAPGEAPSWGPRRPLPGPVAHAVLFSHPHNPPSNFGAEAPRSLCPDPSQMRRGARPRLGGSYSPALRPEETGLICKADDSRKGQSTSACTHCAPPVRMCTAGDEGAVRMVTRTFRRCWAGHRTATRLSQHLCVPQEGPFRFHRLRFCSPSTRLGTESYPWAKCGWKLGIRFRRA